MRTKYSFLNISVGLGNQLILTLLGFVSRTVFIGALGAEYLGINGLFTNILSMLALAEAGIGQSIVYSLYKPVAEHDITQINLLMRLYKYAYFVIAGVITLLGLALLPFLHLIIKHTAVQHLDLIYLIFLLNTIAPYLYIHKSSFLNVCQKNYLVTMLYSISSILSVCFKIGILYYTKNYILYLCIDSFLTITNSIFLALIVNRMYPFLKQKVEGKLDPSSKRQIIKNVKAIVLQNAGSYFVLGTDNIFISSFVSLVAVGLYSNYKMLIDICRNFLNQVSANTYHSFGNLLAQATKDKIYGVYKASALLNFWLYSLFAIFLLSIVQPMITLWLGSSYLLGKGVLLILAANFLERGMRNAITTIKTTAGIYREDKYAPLIQAGLNAGLIYLGVRLLGIEGIFGGTFVSALLVPFWFTPYLVYRKVFHKPLIYYFLYYGMYMAAACCSFLMVLYFNDTWIAGSGIPALLERGGIALLVPNACYFALFHRSNEFKYLFRAALSLTTAFRQAIKRRRLLSTEQET